MSNKKVIVIATIVGLILLAVAIYFYVKMQRQAKEVNSLNETIKKIMTSGT